MKALILAGGNSTRYASGRPEPVHKCLAEIDGKRLAEFSLDAAVRLGFEEIIMVVGHMADQVMRTYGEKHKGVPISYAIQSERRGLVHAITCARGLLGETDFLLLLSDEVYLEADHEKMLETFHRKNPVAICGMVPSSNPELIARNYTIDFDKSTRRILRLEEKPVQPFSPFIGTGSCIFKSTIFDWLERAHVDSRTGNIELVSLIQAAVDAGQKVLCHEFKLQHYVNVNTSDDYRRLLAAIDPLSSRIRRTSRADNLPWSHSEALQLY
jgi:dTDP-glucose pyrophosphorylase